MSNWWNKNFKKSKCVKVLIHYPDHRVKTHYVIPHGEYVIINKNSFVIDKDNVYFDEKSFPTYLFKFDDIEPINIQPINAMEKKEKPIKSPMELYTQAESKLMQQFIMGMGGGLDLQTIALVISVVTLFAMGFGLYTLYSEVNKLQEVIGGLVNGN